MLRPVSSLPLGSSVRLRLGGAGFQFTADLKHLSPDQLSTETGLNHQEALEVLQAVTSDGGGVSFTALELLQKEAELKSIVTFSSQLDAALGGGVPVGKTTEVCGVPGIGKTQLCLQLAVDVQIPECFGGVGGQALFIDTEGSFTVQRLVDLAAAAVRHCSLLVEDDEQRDAMTMFTVETILSNLFLVRCRDYVELLAEVHLLPDFLSQHPNIRLLVIDSVAFPFRLLFDELSQRTRLLNGLAQRLITTATSHNIAVVMTNQMTTRVQQGGQSQLVPALGDSWGHAATLRLLLQWAGSQRMATLFKSSCHMDTTVQYQITSDGFRDTDQSEQPQSKRPRIQTDQSASSQRDGS
ncbi:LOW QUALITY PROTEIN: DNA repair protein RAD51 homolog 3-like [Sphaeramia orbicularis]|uniref:LOW QUALITY PROTEIN: DNA repair protein RAD51 homolog 3-like n=1 Tax=Sphaeramia orbicularis TaxID=375764 RepID=UPI00117C20FA|nr:LOW QUALITY PROTEIN: DNA repair protein RAD51 homolog 3-like [Sphaeramia orbicularis]